MSKNSTHIFIILGLSLWTTHATATNETTAAPQNLSCADCWEDNEKCRIEKIGYSCQKKPRKSSAEPHFSIYPESVKDLSVCIPPNLKIEVTDIEICCVWSPKLGCQMLLSDEHDHMGCYICTADEDWVDFKDLARCPCVWAHAGRLYGSTLSVFVTYLVREFVKNLVTHS